MNDEPPEVIDLHPSEWKRKEERPAEPFFGQRWWVIPAYFIVVAGLTALGTKGGPWALIIAKSL